MNKTNIRDIDEVKPVSLSEGRANYFVHRGARWTSYYVELKIDCASSRQAQKTLEELIKVTGCKISG